jgi:hypothetical protein
MTRLEAYRERYANIHFDRQTGLALKGLGGVAAQA